MASRRDPPGARSLRRLLEPYSLDRFLQQDLSNSSRHVRGTRGKFDRLFSWKILNRALATQRLQPPRLRVAMKSRSQTDAYAAFQRFATRNGEQLARIDTEQLNELLLQGATLVLSAVDEMHPPLQRLCEDMARFFVVDPQINVYASWGHSESFGVHWDAHDVFVLQVSGAKRWKIYGPSKPAPLFSDKDSNASPPHKPLKSLTLRAGDLLYIPRGHWHTAVSNDSPSLHLSLGISALTGADYCSWVVEQACESLQVRQDLPLTADGAALREAHLALSEELNRSIARHTPRDFLDYHRSLLRRTPSTAFPFGVVRTCLPTPQQRVQLVGPLIPQITISARLVTVEAQGATYCFASKAAAALQVLLDGQIHSVQQIIRSFTGSLSSTFLRSLIHELLACGLVRLRD